MTEPTTPLKALIIPNTGDLVGTWGSAAINPDMSAIDGMLGGAQSLSLSAATTFTLSAPAGAITPGAGPNQAQNAILKFTGTLTGNAAITLPLPGYYIVNNACTVGAFYVQLRAVGTGNLIGVPPGKASKIWNDGTDCGFCDPPDVGSYLDLCASTTPGWYAACSVLPYLLCNGAIYSTSTFPALGAQIGSTFGGNGVSTFGVPDLLGRYRIPLGGASGRITAAGSGIDATVLGAAGGTQLLQAHTHTNTLTDTGHTHPTGAGDQFLDFINGGSGGSFTITAPGPFNVTASPNSGSRTTGITVTNATSGAGASGNIPPGLVAGITLIKT